MLLSQYLRGVYELDPTQKIAADLNGTGSITAFDLIEIRKLLLFVTTPGPGDRTHHYVPGYWDLGRLLQYDLEDFQEVFKVNPGGEYLHVGIKLGDIDGSRSFADDEKQSETRSSQLIRLKDQQIRSGQQVRVPVRIEGAGPLLGYQMSWHIDDSQLRLKRVLDADGRGAGIILL